jgi:hypothetical protein
LKQRSKKAVPGIPNSELRRVNAHRQSAGARIEVISHKGPLAAFIEPTGSG